MKKNKGLGALLIVVSVGAAIAIAYNITPARTWINDNVVNPIVAGGVAWYNDIKDNYVTDSTPDESSVEVSSEVSSEESSASAAVYFVPISEGDFAGTQYYVRA